jgi:hypothetical protein
VNPEEPLLTPESERFVADLQLLRAWNQAARRNTEHALLQGRPIFDAIRKTPGKTKRDLLN